MTATLKREHAIFGPDYRVRSKGGHHTLAYVYRMGKPAFFPHAKGWAAHKSRYGCEDPRRCGVQEHWFFPRTLNEATEYPYYT